MVIRDVAEKMLGWVDRIKAIGDIVVQFDPVHAALPWAGFRFLLGVGLVLFLVYFVGCMETAGYGLPVVGNG